jgi:hypothetical protein
MHRIWEYAIPQADRRIPLFVPTSLQLLHSNKKIMRNDWHIAWIVESSLRGISTRKEHYGQRITFSVRLSLPTN